MAQKLRCTKNGGSKGQMRRGSGPKVNTSSGESEIMIYRPPMEVFAQKVETLEIGRQETTILDVKEAMAAMAPWSAAGGKHLKAAIWVPDITKNGSSTCRFTLSRPSTVKCID